ncbi:MAG: hypothetical protein ABS76_07590 [Pelagibacterium sp. SCN 64-44]|nr:MAG: hypothetical protein ABS76_07590 [Pelagibacterium sp. SCN 64-44]
MQEAEKWVTVETPAPYVTLIRFNRTDKKNALHSTMVMRLGDLLREAADDPKVRCVVLTGDDRAFSAGSDIKEMLEKGPAGTANHPRRVAAWRTIERFSKPMIAAVNGVAFGAGNELAMCCDFVVAGETAQFGQPEVRIGGIAGDGGTQRLPRKFGPNLASYMLMTGMPIDAAMARHVGYVVKVCRPEETVAEAVKIGEQIARNAPLSIRLTKECIRTAVGATLENGVAFERDCVWRNSQGPDRQEGMSAFVDKRTPVFPDS